MGVPVLLQHVDTHHVVELVASGDGMGYLLKDHVGDIAEFGDAVSRIAAGGSGDRHHAGRDRAGYALARLCRDSGGQARAHHSARMGIDVRSGAPGPQIRGQSCRRS